MTPGKRLCDLVMAGLLAGPVLLLLAGILPWLWLRQGGPLFYVADRMRAPGQAFGLIKLRTMTVAETDSGVSGGDKAARVTPAGAWLRARRLDELPQLWNILRGDLSFVGPRPPLREYVDRFPALYARVLASRPGVTGLATLVYHRHEARLLARCTTAQETDAVYTRICVPAKARLDLIYQAHRSICYDGLILWRTLRAMLRRPD